MITNLIQDVGTVGAGQHDNALRGGESVHLHQQLVQRVLPLIIAAGKAALATRPPDGVNLICSVAVVISRQSLTSSTNSTFCTASCNMGKCILFLPTGGMAAAG